MLLTELKALKIAQHQQGRQGNAEEGGGQGGRRKGKESVEGGLPSPSSSSSAAPDGMIRRLRGHLGPVLCLAMSPDNNRLYSGGRDGTVRAWDHLLGDAGAGAGAVLVMAGHAAAVCALAVDAGGKRLYSAGADNVVRVWLLADGSCLRSSNLFALTHADATSYFGAPQRAYSHSFAPQHKVACLDPQPQTHYKLTLTLNLIL